MSPGLERVVRWWRRLDGSALRPIWPFGLGAGLAGLSLLITRSVVWALPITAILCTAISLVGRRVGRQLEELDRMAD